MSKYMLNDSNAINDFNPFVVGEFNLPGTWSDAYPYDRTGIVTDKESMFEESEESPLCRWGVTATTDNLRGGLECEVPFKQPPKVSCPMERDLVPRQLTDPGAWTYHKKPVDKKQSMLIPILMLLLAIVLGIFLVKK